MRGTLSVRSCGRIPFVIASALALLAVPGLATQAQSNQQRLQATLDEQGRIDTASQQSQNTVERLANESNEYLADYRVALQQLDRLRIYNDNLEQLVASQEREKSSIAAQLDDFSNVEQGIVPLMYEMIDDLGAFIELDMPFSQRERRDRVQRLQDNMERSDLTVSEKYRQIMEAYEIETTYGRTIEAYTGSLVIGGEERKVDLFRIGRILLAYQTPDRSSTGFWDKTTGQWTELGSEYRRAVTEGLAIARKQAAPMLLNLPIPAAEAAQ
jgi:hypothetical protein